MPPSYQQFLQIGKILNMHGIQGEVKAEHWCDSPSVPVSYTHLARLRMRPRPYPIRKNHFVNKCAAI